jgi:hypothetical protein
LLELPGRHDKRYTVKALLELVIGRIGLVVDQLVVALVIVVVLMRPEQIDLARRSFDAIWLGPSKSSQIFSIPDSSGSLSIRGICSLTTWKGSNSS